MCFVSAVDGGVVEAIECAALLAVGGVLAEVAGGDPVVGALPVGGGVGRGEGVVADEEGSDAFGVSVAGVHGQDGDARAHGLDDGVAAALGVFVEEEVGGLECGADVGAAAGEDAAVANAGGEEDVLDGAEVARADGEPMGLGVEAEEAGEVVGEGGGEEPAREDVAGRGEDGGVLGQAQRGAGFGGDGGPGGGVAPGGFDVEGRDAEGFEEGGVEAVAVGVVADDGVDAADREGDPDGEVDLRGGDAGGEEGGVDGAGGAGDGGEEGGAEGAGEVDRLLDGVEERAGGGDEGDGGDAARTAEEILAETLGGGVGEIEVGQRGVAAGELVGDEQADPPAGGGEVLGEAEDVVGGGLALDERGEGEEDGARVARGERGGGEADGVEDLGVEVGEGGGGLGSGEKGLLVLLDVEGGGEGDVLKGGVRVGLGEGGLGVQEVGREVGGGRGHGVGIGEGGWAGPKGRVRGGITGGGRGGARIAERTGRGTPRSEESGEGPVRKTGPRGNGRPLRRTRRT